MRARNMGVRRLAREVGASASHISRILSSAQPKRPGQQLIERVAVALELPPDYFLETRRARVNTRLAANPALVDHLYDRER